MTLKNEYIEVLEKFNSLPVEESNKMLAQVTANQMTPYLENAELNLRVIPGVGHVMARAILFAIGINLE